MDIIHYVKIKNVFVIKNQNVKFVGWDKMINIICFLIIVMMLFLGGLMA